MDTSWRTAAEKLLNSLPFGHADAAAIVVGCQQFPLDERGPMMIAALARRFGTEVGLDAGEYDTCRHGPEPASKRPVRHLRVV